MLMAGAILVFLISFIALRHLQPDGILFYQGCALGVLIAGIQVVLARLRKVDWSVSLKDGLLTLLLIYSFVFTVPVTVDRSYSVKMLQHLADAPAGLSRDEVNQNYISEFVRHGGVDKRLMEQQATGTIEKQNDVYVLTGKGRFLDHAFRWTCQLFACQQ